MGDKHVQVTETIAAEPAQLYDMVADLTKMGQWSPETVGGKWVGDVHADRQLSGG